VGSLKMQSSGGGIGLNSAKSTVIHAVSGFRAQSDVVDIKANSTEIHSSDVINIGATTVNIGAAVHLGQGGPKSPNITSPEAPKAVRPTIPTFPHLIKESPEDSFMIRHEDGTGGAFNAGEIRRGMTSGALSRGDLRRNASAVLPGYTDNGTAPTQSVGDKSINFNISNYGDLSNTANPIYREKVSEHFYLADFVWNVHFSRHRLYEKCGTPVSEIIKNISHLAVVLADPLYEKYGGCHFNQWGRKKSNFLITCGFRGNGTGCGSKHSYGMAFDFQLSGAPKSIYINEATWIRDNINGWDAILLEYFRGRNPVIHVQAQRTVSRGITNTRLGPNQYAQGKFVDLSYV
jgi:hypothetical protein